jgi:hypothetical protein
MLKLHLLALSENLLLYIPAPACLLSTSYYQRAFTAGVAIILALFMAA